MHVSRSRGLREPVSYIERDEIRPNVADTYPLERIVDAQREFLSKTVVGKWSTDHPALRKRRNVQARSRRSMCSRSICPTPAVSTNCRAAGNTEASTPPSFGSRQTMAWRAGARAHHSVRTGSHAFGVRAGIAEIAPHLLGQDPRLGSDQRDHGSGSRWGTNMRKPLLTWPAGTCSGSPSVWRSAICWRRPA